MAVIAGSGWNSSGKDIRTKNSTKLSPGANELASSTAGSLVMAPGACVLKRNKQRIMDPTGHLIYDNSHNHDGRAFRNGWKKGWRGGGGHRHQVELLFACMYS